MNKEGSNWETIFREEIRQAGLGCAADVCRSSRPRQPGFSWAAGWKSKGLEVGGGRR